jgi:hypothetical protein
MKYENKKKFKEIVDKLIQALLEFSVVNAAEKREQGGWYEMLKVLRTDGTSVFF